MAPEALLDLPARRLGETTAGPARLRELRLMDFGTVSALRSQSLWHALAHGVGRGLPATVALCRPAQPYVSLGYHRPLEEVDLGACARFGLPVLRRMVGGGTVYLDSGQLFFQVVVPPELVSPVPARALARLLEPARLAFRAAGLPARFDRGELAVGGRKVCGHGAGRLDGAVVVVGNLLERFDPGAAAGVLSAPDERSRRRLRGRMANLVGPPPGAAVDAGSFARGLLDACGEVFGVRPTPGSLAPVELRALRRFDRLLGSTRFVQGPARPGQRGSGDWVVKVRSGVVEGRVARGPTRLWAVVVDGALRDVELEDPEEADPGALAEALEGQREPSPVLDALEARSGAAARVAAAARALLARSEGGGR
jgi:lipoate-protein ligase A